MANEILFGFVMVCMAVILKILSVWHIMITVKQLGPSDCQSYRTIRLESLRIYPDWFAADYEKERLKSVLFFEEQLRFATDSGKAVFGAFNHDALIGICAVAFILEGQAELLQVYVKDEFRGHGILNRLICLAKGYVKAQGGTLLSLEVHPSNQIAIRGYRRAGFSVRITDDVDHNDSLFMDMRLLC